MFTTKPKVALSFISLSAAIHVGCSASARFTVARSLFLAPFFVVLTRLPEELSHENDFQGEDLVGVSAGIRI